LETRKEAGAGWECRHSIEQEGGDHQKLSTSKNRRPSEETIKLEKIRWEKRKEALVKKKRAPGSLPKEKKTEGEKGRNIPSKCRDVEKKRMPRGKGTLETRVIEPPKKKI